MKLLLKLSLSDFLPGNQRARGPPLFSGLVIAPSVPQLELGGKGPGSGAGRWGGGRAGKETALSDRSALRVINGPDGAAVSAPQRGRPAQRRQPRRPPARPALPGPASLGSLGVLVQRILDWWRW